MSIHLSKTKQNNFNSIGTYPPAAPIDWYGITNWRKCKERQFLTRTPFFHEKSVLVIVFIWVSLAVTQILKHVSYRNDNDNRSDPKEESNRLDRSDHRSNAVHKLESSIWSLHSWPVTVKWLSIFPVGGMNEINFASILRFQVGCCWCLIAIRILRQPVFSILYWMASCTTSVTSLSDWAHFC